MRLLPVLGALSKRLGQHAEKHTAQTRPVKGKLLNSIRAPAGGLGAYRSADGRLGNEAVQEALRLAENGLGVRGAQARMDQRDGAGVEVQVAQGAAGALANQAGGDEVMEVAGLS